MSYIIAQQTKLDLELVPKEKRFEIRKCNRRLNPRKKQREPTFQVVLDDLALIPCYYAFLTIADVPENLVIRGKSSQSPMLLLIRCINLRELLLLSSTEVYLERQSVLTSFVCLGLNSFGVCTLRRLWTTLNYFEKISLTRLTTKVTKSKRRCITLDLPKLSFTTSLPKTRHPETRETKAYKTYLGYATGVTPLKKARKFKKLTFLKLTTVTVSPEEPIRKSKRVKRPAKKSTNAPTAGVVIRDTPVMSLSKKKENVTVEKRKGIDLLSEVALTEEAQYEEVHKKNLRDFHKTHPIGFEENEEDVEDNEEEKDDEFIKTPSISTDDEDETNEKLKLKNKAEGDEDKGMDYTTNQFDDDVNILSKEVSNFAPPMIKTMVTKSLEHVVLAKESSQPKFTYEVVALLIEFKLKKILIDKMDESQSYLTATEHRECYDGFIKSYNLDKSLFSTYDKVYSLKKSQKDKDKDKDPSAGLNQMLKKRKTSKDTKPTKEYKVAYSDMPQDQEENMGNHDEELKKKVASKCKWFTKLKQPKEPPDLDRNVSKTP
uniref:Uncharacterized protein n=1 Tax=Tanacetum cinerariifolium TaxID=118510 RepID=A0A6L2LM61_TANCI|nr:hypothetical protein [Tanacetum cinerariifolium]